MMALGSMLVFVAACSAAARRRAAGPVSRRSGPCTGRSQPRGGAQRHLGDWSNAIPRRVTAVGLAFLAITALGIFRLEVATDFDENFRAVQPHRPFLSLRVRADGHDLDVRRADRRAATPAEQRGVQRVFGKAVGGCSATWTEHHGVTGTMGVADILDFASSTDDERAGPLGIGHRRRARAPDPRATADGVRGIAARRGRRVLESRAQRGADDRAGQATARRRSQAAS